MSSCTWFLNSKSVNDSDEETESDDEFENEAIESEKEAKAVIERAAIEPKQPPKKTFFDEPDDGETYGFAEDTKSKQALSAAALAIEDKEQLVFLKRAVHIAGLWEIKNNLKSMHDITFVKRLFKAECVKLKPRMHIRSMGEILPNKMADCAMRVGMPFTPSVWLADELMLMAVRPDLIPACVIAIAENVLHQDAWTIAIRLYNAFVNAHRAIVMPRKQ